MHGVIIASGSGSGDSMDEWQWKVAFHIGGRHRWRGMDIGIVEWMDRRLDGQESGRWPDRGVDMMAQN